jgi:hypothetical protein
MFEEVGEFSNFWTVVCEGCLFLVVVFILCLVDFLVLYLYFQICYEALWEGIVLCHGANIPIQETLMIKNYPFKTKRRTNKTDNHFTGNHSSTKLFFI